MSLTYKLRKQSLLLISLYYLYIPLAFFLCGWVKLWISLPLTILLGILPFALYRNLNKETIRFTRRQLLITVTALFLWVFLSGIGGFVWQNYYDHTFRNAVFNDLVNKPWPVAEGQSILTYYIGYWLPSAALAKVTGSMLIGRISQMIYGFIGIILAFFLTIEKLGNFKIRYILPFILFSGLDIIGVFISNQPKYSNLHTELWSPLAFWESNTTLLFWVYNQAIPSWVATMIILNNRRKKGVAVLTLCFLSISAPFSVIGLFPLTLYYVIETSIRTRNLSEALKLLFCPVNIISLLGTIPVIMYFTFNDHTATTISFQSLGSLTGIRDLILILLLEILVFCIFIYKQIIKNIDFYILLFTSLLCLYVHMGVSLDFGSRVELPLNYFLTTQLIIYIANFEKKPRLERRLFVCVSILAIITPLIEISRTIFQSIRHPRTEYMAFDKKSIFEFQILRQNFVTDSVYNRTKLPFGFTLFRYSESNDERCR